MGGNGIDIGSVHQLLSRVAETVVRLEAAVARHEAALERIERTMATKADLAELRQTVTHYHSSVVGHGILISDLEARVRRVEEHLDLLPLLGA